MSAGIRRRCVRKSAAALAVGGPARLTSLRAGAEARVNVPQGKALFAYVGTFTTPERKGNGDGINVYRVDPRSGMWTHVQLMPGIVNPSFLAVDHGQRVLYSVHADLDEVSAYQIDQQSGQLTPLNRVGILVGGIEEVRSGIESEGGEPRLHYLCWGLGSRRHRRSESAVPSLRARWNHRGRI